MIFISHKETEAPIASSLVDLLLTSMPTINRVAVVCTSVPGHQLPFGKTISEALKDNIGSSSAVFAILTQESIKSEWVIFELGASWALSKIVIPILAPGLTDKNLPGPLKDYPCISIDKPDAAARICDSLTQVAHLLRKKPQVAGAFQAKLKDFISAFGATRAGTLQARAFLLSFLLIDYLLGTPKSPENVKGQITAHAKYLEVSLPPDWDNQVDRELEERGKAANKIFDLLGGQINAKGSAFVPYFEAGGNLFIDAVKGGGQHFNEIINELNIPESVRISGSTSLEKINSVAAYFQEIVRQ